MNSILLTEKVKKSRDQVMKEMEACNIEMRPVFYPMHIMPPYRNVALDCPNAVKIGERGINLPSHALLDEEKLDYIVECLEKIILE